MPRAWPSRARQAVTEVELTLNIPSTSMREATVFQESVAATSKIFAGMAAVSLRMGV